MSFRLRDMEPHRKKRRVETTSDDEDSNATQNPDFNVDDVCMSFINISISSSFQSSWFTQDTPEVGVIERITLNNFMCHTVQDIRFGARANFLIGNNGSGKSAVMTGVVIGLGGKASSTSRGQSIKNFVKYGSRYDNNFNNVMSMFVKLISLHI